MHNIWDIRRALLAGAAVTTIGFAQPAAAQMRVFNVPALDAASGVTALARQADAQILISGNAARGKRTRAVKGQMNIEQALQELLRGTGLIARQTAPAAWSILPARQTARAQLIQTAAAGAIQVAMDPPEQASSQVIAEEASETASQEIVVTASRREERLRDVPAAITAITGETLENQGVTSFRDYASLVPGLSQRDSGAPGFGTVILRGLNTGPQQITNTTAFYIDDAPFSSSGFLGVGGLVKPEPELADIDRIEVLKGPQGTLYGASSLGGLIRIVSKRPEPNDFSGNLRVEATTVSHGNEGFAVRGSVNLPLVQDKLAARVTAYYRRLPGWADNVGTGTNDVNDGDSVGARLAFRWTPTENLAIDLIGIYQDIDSNGLAQQDNVTDTLIPLYGKRQYSQFIDSKTLIRYRLATATVDYDFGPMSLISTLSYAKTKLTFNTDYTEAYGIFLPLFGYPPGTGLVAPGGPGTKKFTAESRLVSERMGRFEFVLGAFYTNEKSAYPIDIDAIDIATGVPISDPLGNFITTLTTSDYEEIAGFGNVTFYITDDLDVTGGLRYARNTEDVLNFNSGLLATNPAGVTNLYTFTDSATTYLGTLRWRPTDNLSTFFRVASGYRPGGPQTNPVLPPGAQTSINPDTVWSYEAGIKGALVPGKVDFSASIYRIDWSDIQLNSLAGGFVLQGNGGDARVDGFELELAAKPNRNLTMGASLGYTNARVTRIDPGPAAYLGAANGDKLPLTPEWTAAAYADQIFALSDGIYGTVGATLRHESDKPSSFPGSALNPNVQIPSITTLDLRAGVRFDGYMVQLRAENIFDSNGFTSVTTGKVVPGQLVATQAILIRPRTFTLSLSTEF
ncbi:TonB-dependent receptor [Sphingosinicella rhizophila]|uniref:TonB-dependent receptor n=1 Tax=Sphingosinicella rhizophila TaxID=3050082 RepID=A0ABU3Q1X3_9SPHN|nr:TonB-dependent receptor [Sphingosinicella sp. GR2756]MDT9597374.1 TonB-dependent receptor [Sphingosinicella sp. GR2756]